MSEQSQNLEGSELEFLSLDEVVMVDQALSSIGQHGSVRLTVSKGRLRFLSIEISYDALKWEEGQFPAD